MNIKNDFGYTRLKGRSKTCVKCRGRSRENKKVYQEKRKEYRGQFDQEVYDHHQYCTICYKIKPKIDDGEHNHRTLSDGTGVMYSAQIM